MKTMHGQTLLELMTCLLIGCILLSFAIPSLSSALQNNQETQLANQLVAALNYARGSAVLGRKTIGLCSGSATCKDSQRWGGHILIFNDQNRNGQLDAEEQVLRQEELAANYAWHWSNFRHRSFLQFEQDGTTRALNGTLTLCREDRPVKQIVINLTGRVRTQAPSNTAHCN